MGANLAYRDVNVPLLDFFPYTQAVVNNKGETVFKPVQDEWSEIEVKFYYQEIGGPEMPWEGLLNSGASMTQDEKWIARYNEVVTFIETNKRNPSKYDAEERGDYYTWLKANRKAMNAGKMKAERVEMFEKLQALMEEYKRVNQYQ